MMNICIHRHLYTCIYTCQGGQSQGRYKVDPGGLLGGLLQCCAVIVLQCCQRNSFHCKSGWTLLGFPCCQRLHHGLHPWILLVFTFSVFSLDYSMIWHFQFLFFVRAKCKLIVDLFRVICPGRTFRPFWMSRRGSL